MPVVPPRVSLITLGVADVVRATAFYDALGWRRSSASVEGVVSFFDLDGHGWQVMWMDPAAAEQSADVSA